MIRLVGGDEHRRARQIKQVGDVLLEVAGCVAATAVDEVIIHIRRIGPARLRIESIPLMKLVETSRPEL